MAMVALWRSQALLVQACRDCPRRGHMLSRQAHLVFCEKYNLFKCLESSLFHSEQAVDVREARVATMAGSDTRGRGISSEERFVIFASSLGTVFEWYDFYPYAILPQSSLRCSSHPATRRQRCSRPLPRMLRLVGLLPT